MAMQQFSRSLPMMLNRTLDVVMPRFRKIFKEFGITEQQWRILRVLWEVDELPLGELADTTLIPAPSLVGIVDRLQTAKFVVRRPSKQDRRVVLVAATPAGRDLLQRLLPQVATAYADLKLNVDPVIWQQLLDGLDAIAVLAEKNSNKQKR